MDASSALVEDGKVTLVNPHLIHVESGDLLGFSFTNGNPIPYDSTYHCDHHGKVVFRQNTTVPVGGIVSMITKDDAQLGCRLYSLFAKVEVQGSDTVLFYVSVVLLGNLYRVSYQ